MSIDYEQIWSMLPFPALVIAPDDQVTEANAAAETILKTSQKQLRRRRLAELFGPSSVIVDTAAQARAGQGSLMQYNVEVALGGPRAVQCNVHLGWMSAPEAHLLLIIQPIGVAQKMSRSLTHMAAARSVEAMSAMLAHELRNPLAGISGAAQLLSMEAGAEAQELTDLIQQETRRIGQLVERVEHFSDSRPPEVQAVNIHDVLDRTRRAAKAGFAAHVNFTVDYDPSLPDAIGDPVQLQQVFQNLVKNAAEAAEKGRGAIKIRTSYNSGVKFASAGSKTETLPLQIEVIDNGKGIPGDLIGDIFEPFVTSKANGSGLGLPLVSKIVSAHGGLIECTSEPGRTRFCVRLPIWRAPRTVKE